MSARDHAGPERRSSGPGLGLTGEEAKEFIAFFRDVVAEHKAQQQPAGRLAWLLKPGLAAMILGAVLSQYVLGGMNGCNRSLATMRAMDSHQSADDKQHAAEAQKWLDVTGHMAAQDIRLEKIEGNVRWLVKRAGGPVDQ